MIDTIKFSSKPLSVGLSVSSFSSGITDGIGHYTQQLRDHLISSGVQCRDFAMCGFKKRKPENGIVYYNYRSQMLRTLFGWVQYGRFQPNVDIFHCTDYRLIPMACPTVTTLHDAIPMAHPEWHGTSMRERIVRYCIYRSAHCAHHVIAISNHAKQDIMRYYRIKEEKISVVYNAIDDQWFLPVDRAYRDVVLKQYRLQPGYFLAVGTLQPRKNFDRLIDAYLLLPTTIRQAHPLVIVGKYGWNAEALVHKMQALIAAGSLIWLSNVNSDHELRCIYAGAHVFVFPSLYEGFGLPLVEAFASGIPVVCSNTTAIPEISRGAGLEVNPESVGELSAAMHCLATNVSERDMHIQSGIQQSAQFRWERTLRETLDVYHHVLQR